MSKLAQAKQMSGMLRAEKYNLQLAKVAMYTVAQEDQ
jgi:hypothetical protein